MNNKTTEEDKNLRTTQDKGVSLSDLLYKISSFKGYPHIARKRYSLCKKHNIKLATILLVPSLPRVERKNAIYQDGTVIPLSEVRRFHVKTAVSNPQKPHLGGGKL